MLGLSRPIRARRHSGWSPGGLWQGCCGRWHAMVMAGEQAVPEPLEAAWRHLLFYDSQ